MYGKEKNNNKINRIEWFELLTETLAEKSPINTGIILENNWWVKNCTIEKKVPCFHLKKKKKKKFEKRKKKKEKSVC